MNTPRVPLVGEPYSAPVAEVLSRLMPPGVPPLALFRALAVNERVFLRVAAGGLLDRGTLTLRQRELVIHRTCARLGSEYEWGVHAAFFAKKAGLTASDLAATMDGDHGPGLADESERLLLALVDALVDTATVGAALWAQLEAAFTHEQLVELVILVGFYHMISFATNAFAVAPEPFARRFAEFVPERG